MAAKDQTTQPGPVMKTPQFKDDLKVGFKGKTFIK